MKFKANMSVKSKAAAARIIKAGSKMTDTVGMKVAEATLMVHAETVRAVAKQSAGERQTRYNPRREVIASKPGDPPNVDFGVFLRSIQFEVDPQKNVGYVGTNDKRGPWFEFGTRTMAPRPWLSVGYGNAKQGVLKLFREIKFKIDDKK